MERITPSTSILVSKSIYTPDLTANPTSSSNRLGGQILNSSEAIRERRLQTLQSKADFELQNSIDDEHKTELDININSFAQTNNKPEVEDTFNEVVKERPLSTLWNNPQEIEQSKADFATQNSINDTNSTQFIENLYIRVIDPVDEKILKSSIRTADSTEVGEPLIGVQNAIETLREGILGLRNIEIGQIENFRQNLLSSTDIAQRLNRINELRIFNEHAPISPGLTQFLEMLSIDHLGQLASFFQSHSILSFILFLQLGHLFFEVVLENFVFNFMSPSQVFLDFGRTLRALFNFRMFANQNNQRLVLYTQANRIFGEVFGQINTAYLFLRNNLSILRNFFNRRRSISFFTFITLITTAGVLIRNPRNMRALYSLYLNIMRNIYKDFKTIKRFLKYK